MDRSRLLLFLGLACVALAGLSGRAEGLADSDGDTLPDEWEVLHGLDPNEPAGTHLVAPALKGAFNTPGYARHVVLREGLALVSDGPGGLALIDVAIATNPVQLGTLAVTYPQEVRCSSVISNHVYIPLWGLEAWLWTTEVGVYDITDPAQIGKVGSVITNGLAWSIAAGEERVYVGILKMYRGSFLGTLPGSVVEILDVSNPANPVPVQTLQDFAFAREVKVDGDLLLVADLQAGAVFVSVDGLPASAPPHCPLPAWQEGDKLVYSLARFSNVVYGACGRDGVAVWDVNDPGNPSLIGSVPLPGISRSIVLASNMAAVAAGPAGVMILDVTDSTHPVRAGRLIEASCAESVALWDGMLYVADGSNGLVIAELTDDDMDRDGLSDAWERLHFGGLDMEAADDPDGDGISNLGEFRADLDPRSSDQDGDLMPDGWEVAHLLNPWVDDGDEDPDRDGSCNREESIAGTNPQRNDSVFGITGFSASGRDVIVFEPAVTGRLYSLYGTTNLLQPFEQLASDLTADPPTGSITSPLSSGDNSFLRVGVRKPNP